MLNDVIVREIMNGTWFLLSVMMVVTFAVYLLDRKMRGGDWYQRPGSQAAIALSIFLSGSAIRAGWIWWLLHCHNNRLDCTAYQKSWGILIIGTILVVVGGLCCVRVFSPVSWRPWSWIVAGIISVAAPVFVYVEFSSFVRL